jgi:2-methylcitrate dehydratase
MERIDFRHGGKEYDDKYPDGIPTSLEIEHAELGRLESGLVMYPVGHARNSGELLGGLLEHKFQLLTKPAVDDPAALYLRFTGLAAKSAAEIRNLYDFQIRGVS